jgi:hypothetical protein
MNANVLSQHSARSRRDPGWTRTPAEIASRKRFLRVTTFVLAVTLAVAAGVLVDGWVTPTHAEVVGQDLLNATVVPPDAQPVSDPPTQSLAAAPYGYGCSPVADRTRFWLVPGSLSSVVTFLRTHVPKGMQYDGAGGVTNGPPEFISMAPTGKASGVQTRALALSFAAVDGISVGLRADGMAVPASATCIHH